MYLFVVPSPNIYVSIAHADVSATRRLAENRRTSPLTERELTIDGQGLETTRYTKLPIWCRSSSRDLPRATYVDRRRSARSACGHSSGRPWPGSAARTSQQPYRLPSDVPPAWFWASELVVEESGKRLGWP